MIETEYVEIERAKLQALLDVAINSMDFGSGFWDQEDANAARWAAEALGLCPNAATPSNILEHFPPCEGLWRRVPPPYVGYDGRSYQSDPSYQHLDHDKTPIDSPSYGAKWERWPWPEPVVCEHANRQYTVTREDRSLRQRSWACADCGAKGIEPR